MKNILVVDDEEDVREVIFDLLRSHFAERKIQLFQSADFQTAKDMLFETYFDLIIVDLCIEGNSGDIIARFLRNTSQNMTRKTGIELAEIAKINSGGRTKTVAITGLVDMLEQKPHMPMFDHVIEKPFTKQFPITIEEILNKPKST